MHTTNPDDKVLIADGDDSDRILRNAGYAPIEAVTGDEAIELARAHFPIAAVLEIPLDGLSGYEVCSTLKSEFGARFPVIFLTGSRTEPYDRVGGLLLGADDYVTKPYVPGELLVRLRNLLHRRTDALAERLSRRLTKREYEVLALMAEGLQQQEIAQRLVISPKTVGTHVEHVLRKLGAHSQAQAIAIAYQHQLLPLPRLTTASAMPPADPENGESNGK